MFPAVTTGRERRPEDDHMASICACSASFPARYEIISISRSDSPLESGSHDDTITSVLFYPTLHFRPRKNPIKTPSKVAMMAIQAV